MRLSVAAAIGLVAAISSNAQTVDRATEGDWYISDNTDNNTGERKVYAMQLLVARDAYIKLTMDCTKGRPTISVEWDDLSFPDQTVFSISPVAADGTNPAEESYVFQKSEDKYDRGLHALPETSAKIVAFIGLAKSAALTAHVASGSRTKVLDVDGTQRAWSRVSRHCPVQIMPRPPL